MFICKQMKLDSYLTPYTGIKYLNVRPETKKLLEETKGKSSLTWVLVMIFFFLIWHQTHKQQKQTKQVGLSHLDFRHQLKVEIVTSTSDQLAVNQRFLKLPSWVQLTC